MSQNQKMSTPRFTDPEPLHTKCKVFYLKYLYWVCFSGSIQLYRFHQTYSCLCLTLLFLYDYRHIWRAPYKYQIVEPICITTKLNQVDPSIFVFTELVLSRSRSCQNNCLRKTPSTHYK
uniref:Uncharacterized protein n=1 Tax=Cacopsylla melanoneura TaxID=428564 RepID=A0A8D8YLC0_9HEMI